ncbi:MAG: RHS repeat domain-containing protein, partial [Blastocatellia bacterium]
SRDANRLFLTGIQATANGARLMNLMYGYSAAAGQMGTGTTPVVTPGVVSVSGAIGGQYESASFSYDLDHHLVTASETSNGQSAGRSYTWDALGNRLTETDTIAQAQIQSLTFQQSGGVTTNRITSVNNSGQNSSYAYDNDGNVTADGTGNTYTYDAENRLVSVTGGVSIQSSYDFRNRRVVDTESGATTHYIWEDNQVLAEMNGANGSMLVDNVLFASGAVAKINSGGTVSYFLRDRLSERLVLDSNAQITAQMGALPFGEDFAESGSQDAYHFTSYKRNGAGDDYAINRYHTPLMGRFRSVDPYPADERHPQSWNRYAYVQGDPVNSVDPQGLFQSCGYFGCQPPAPPPDTVNPFGNPFPPGPLLDPNAQPPDDGGQRPCKPEFVDTALKQVAGELDSDVQNTRALSQTLGYIGGALNGSNPALANNFVNDSSGVDGVVNYMNNGGTLPDIGALTNRINADLNALGPTLPAETGDLVDNLHENVETSSENLKMNQQHMDQLSNCPNLSKQQQQQFDNLTKRWNAMQQSIVPLYQALRGTGV